MKKANITAYAAALLVSLLIFTQCQEKKAGKIPEEKPNGKFVFAAIKNTDSTRLILKLRREVHWVTDTATLKVAADTIWGAPIQDSTGKFLGYQPVADSLIIWDLNNKDADAILNIKK